MTRNLNERTSHRVELRNPLNLTIGEQPAILLELGTGGAKIEHGKAIVIGSRVTLPLPHGPVQSVVRYCMMVPSDEGIVYHTGLEFSDLTHEQTAAIYDMLLDEAQEQVAEWESNLKGDARRRPQFGAHSAAALRFIWLRLTPGGWTRTITTDPNQPIDGIAIPSDTQESEIGMLCSTYARGDDELRQYLRGCAMVAILERLRGGR